MSLQGEAYVQQGNIPEAAQLIGDMAQLTTASRSTRIIQRIGELRGALAPWNGSSAVSELDGRLSRYGLDALPSGRTNRSYAE